MLLDEATDILNRAKALMSGDAHARKLASDLLADLREQYPHRREAQEARDLQIRLQAWEWSALDQADGLDDPIIEWHGIRHLGDSRVRALFDQAFDPQGISSPRRSELQAAMLDFMAGVDYATANVDLLKRAVELYDIAVRYPSSREQASKDRNRIAVLLFRRLLDDVAVQVNDALDRWDAEAAEAALNTLGPAPEGCAGDIAALRARTADIMRRRTLLQKALQGAGSAVNRSPLDVIALAAAVEELATHGKAADLPERFTHAIAEANEAATAAVARWGEKAARDAWSFDELRTFRQEWSRLPSRWQSLQRMDWFAAAWEEILERARTTLAHAKDRSDVEALAARFFDAAPVLPEPLTARTRAVAQAMADVGCAWQQAGAGVVTTLPDLTVLSGPVTLPQPFNDLRNDADAAGREIDEMETILATAGESADVAAAVQERLSRLSARYPDLARAQWLSKRSAAVLARDAVRHALAEWRVDDAIANIKDAEPSIGPDDVAALRDALDGFATLAATQPAGSLESQLIWWNGWLAALGRLLALRRCPPGLDTALRSLQQDRLHRLSALIDSEVKDTTKSPADLRSLINLFTGTENYPPLRFEMERLARRTLVLEFEDAIGNADWEWAERILKELRSLGEPTNHMAVFDLRMDIGRAASAGNLAVRLVERWYDVRTLIPKQAPKLVLDALRSRRLVGQKPEDLDRALANLAVDAARQAPPNSALSEELAFWAQWSELLTDLWAPSALTEEVLRRTAAFFRYSAPGWRRSIISDVRSLIDVWTGRGDAIVLAWASRLFRDLDGIRTYSSRELSAPGLLDLRCLSARRF